MTASLAQVAREAATPVWEKIHRHPFLQELRAGTLPDEKLRFYFEQNIHYIAAVRRFRAIAAAKAPNEKAYAFTVQNAGPPGHDELQHQKEMLRALGGNPDAELAPACYGYTRHLLNIAWNGETVDLLAAFLPCPWSYDEIGAMVKDKLQVELHREWVSFYASEWHNRFCEDYRNIVDELAEGYSEARRQQMIRNFVTSSKYEYWFWETAYTQEAW